ncbi:type IV pilus modification protein PilV [Granulosicoccus sp. 3-233]
MKGRCHQQGVGIIEVLVALVVVSFGVLGMAGLQLTGMKHSNNGFNRSKALILTENIATRMRINEQGVSNGFYDGFDSGNDANYCNVRPVPYCQASKGAAAQSCTAAELAAFDLFSVSCGDWGSEGASGGVEDQLPAGARLVVDCNDSPCEDTSTYTLSVSWPENRTVRSDDAPVERRVQMVLRP